MGAGAQELEPSSIVLQAHQKGAALEVEQLGHELAPKWGDGIVGSSFTSYATTPAPYFTNFVQTHQL